MKARVPGAKRSVPQRTWQDSMSYVTHLESALDGTILPAGVLQTTHRDRPLLVRYDLDRLRAEVGRDALSSRPATMWRYEELLPIAAADAVSLQETVTPLLECPRLAARLGVRRLLVKDESRLPTGSFKARGMATAVSMARHFGVREVAVPTAGNAGGALAAYAARAGLRCHVLMPADAPVVNRYEAALHGANVLLVDGLISDCARIVREGVTRLGWFDMSTLREPYRIEGKKTMGLELAEQMGWRLPDAIFYPTGGGTGLIGMWKAFEELEQIGWLAPGGRPRMYCCQSSGCDPLVRAFAAGARHAEPVDDPRTLAAGLRVPRALGDFMVLEAVEASGGGAIAAEETGIRQWMREACRAEGISLCPESAVCVGALERAVADGHVGPDDEVVLFNTGAAQKYVEAIRVDLPIAKEPIDWASISTDGPT